MNQKYSIARGNILGVQVSAINMQQAIQEIHRWITCGERQYVCVTPAHGIMECQRDPGLLRIFNQSGMTTPDGMAIVWLLKLKGHRHVSRVYGPDLMRNVCQYSIQGPQYRHFFYGGAPGVAEKLSRQLQAQYPGLVVAGQYCPPFRELTPEEDRDVIEMINNCRPEIIWMGISTPKQERWMAAHVGRVNVPVMIGVGAAFDFLSGARREAPRWVQRVGLQWLFRLLVEPRRLWRRYIEYPWFIWLVFKQWIQERRTRSTGSTDPVKTRD